MLGEPVPGTASQLDEPGSAALLDGVDSGTVAVLSEPSQSAARGTARSVETQQNLLRSPGRPVVPLVVLGSALVLLGVLLASARPRHPLVSLPAPGAAAGVGLRPS